MKDSKSKIYNLYIPNSRKIKNKLKLNPFQDNKERLAMILKQIHLNSEKIDLKSTKDDYQYILESFKNLVDQLGLKTPLAVSMLYTYLLRKGYFSKDNNFKFDKKRKIIYKALPYSVIEGKGVCLNISALLVDCLEICGHDAAIIANYSYGIGNSYRLNVEMEKQKYESKKPTNIIKLKYDEMVSKLAGNHAFVMIEENNNYYIYDPTSSTVKVLTSFSECKEITGVGNNELNIFSSYYVNFNKKSLDLLDKYVNDKNKTSKVNPLSVILLGEKMIDFCNKNEELFKDFYYKIYPHIEKISDFVDSLEEKTCKTK